MPSSSRMKQKLASDATIAQRRRVLHSAQKVAVITGAAQGIGRRTAELFAQQGYSLALVDLKPMDATAQAAQNSGAEVLELTGDISNEQSVSHFAASVTDRWGHADVLVNNAGISFISPAEQVSALADRAEARSRH